MRNHIAATVFAFCAVVFLSGCAPEGVTRLDRTKHYVAVSPQKVKIFIDEADVPKRHEKVAVITVIGADDWKAVRKRCAKLGANGVYRKLYLSNSRQPNGYQSAEKVEYVAIRF